MDTEIITEYPHHVSLPFLISPDLDLTWYNDAACNGSLLDFFTEKKSIVVEAKAVCATCPSKVKCLDFATRNDEWGTWGGTTRSDRKARQKEALNG